MTRLALLLTIAVLIGAASAAAAQQPSGKPAGQPAAQNDADLVLPPPHGAPKDMATGATRGLGTRVHAPAEAVTDAPAAEPRASIRSGPRSLTGTPRP